MLNLFCCLWMHFLFTELLPVIMGRGWNYHKMWCLSSEHRILPFLRYPALHPRDPAVSLNPGWIEGHFLASSSWHSQPISFTFNLRSCLSLENALPRDLEQTPSICNPPFNFQLAACFHSSSSVPLCSQNFSSILNPASPLLIFLWILFCF